MKVQEQRIHFMHNGVVMNHLFTGIYGSTSFTNKFSFSSLDWNCYSDCAKPDPEVNGDTEKNFAELLSEELKLRETDALENQRRADMALLESKKIASQYQKEADKCNSGMETCEQAREKAELALVAQKKLTALWELRARQKGWKEGVAKSNAQSQGKVQTS